MGEFSLIYEYMIRYYVKRICYRMEKIFNMSVTSPLDRFYAVNYGINDTPGTHKLRNNIIY